MSPKHTNVNTKDTKFTIIQKELRNIWGTLGQMRPIRWCRSYNLLIVNSFVGLVSKNYKSQQIKKTKTNTS